MEHKLKTWPAYFQRAWDLKKTFEVRKDDRNYQTGDFLVLEEWNPENEQYTGRSIRETVTYVLQGGQFGIEKGYVVMAVEINALHD